MIINFNHDKFLGIGALSRVPPEIFSGIDAEVARYKDQCALYEDCEDYVLQQSIENEASRRIFAEMLKPETINTFMGWYFSNIDPAILKRYPWHKVQMPHQLMEEPDSKLGICVELAKYFWNASRLPGRLAFSETFKTISSFAADDTEQDKKRGQHSLTENQYAQARQYVLGENPQMLYAAHLISAAFSAYAQATKQFLSDHKIKAYPAGQAVRNFKGALSLNSFIEEFLPVMAYFASQSAEGRPLVSKDYAAGMSAMFGKTGTMESKGLSRSDFDKTCPFKGSIGHVMNALYEFEEGQYTLSSQRQHAGFLQFTMDFLARNGVVAQRTSIPPQTDKKPKAQIA